MAQTLRPVAIAELLSAADQSHCWTFDQPISALQASTPVRGWLRLEVEGPLLRVEGEAATTVELCCDRCLRTYVHPLSARVSERLGLGTTAEDLDDALAFDAEGISEQLDPEGSFDPEQWIYEQLSLQLPLVNRCGPECPGPASWGSDQPPSDPRWGALNKLRQ